MEDKKKTILIVLAMVAIVAVAFFTIRGTGPAENSGESIKAMQNEAKKDVPAGLGSVADNPELNKDLKTMKGPGPGK